MARNSRRKSNTSFSPLSKFLMLALVVIGAAGFLTIKQTGVLGTSDRRLTPTPTGYITPTPSVCKPPRVNKFNLSNPCDSNTRDGFRKVEFKCSNDKSMTIERGCMNVTEALNYAKTACAAKYKCPVKIPTPTFRPESPTPTNSAPTPTQSAPTPTASI